MKYIYIFYFQNYFKILIYSHSKFNRNTFLILLIDNKFI